MIGDRIKIIRISNKMNQDEFARSLNVTKEMVFNWENNNVLPPVNIIKTLALTYGVSTDFLLGLIDIP